MSRKFKSNQRGEAKAKIQLAIVLGLIIMIGFVLSKCLPVYMTDRELQHYVSEVARNSVVRKRTETQILRALKENENQYWITLPSDLEYEVRRTEKTVEIGVDVTIPIDLILTTYEYRINFRLADKAL